MEDIGFSRARGFVFQNSSCPLSTLEGGHPRRRPEGQPRLKGAKVILISVDRDATVDATGKGCNDDAMYRIRTDEMTGTNHLQVPAHQLRHCNARRRRRKSKRCLSRS